MLKLTVLIHVLGITALSLSSPFVFAGNFGGVELAPGKSETCLGNPCSVTFVMPEGTGTYEVVQGAPDGTKVGDFPAGETVNLGNFYSSTTFFVKGGDFKPAHVWIGGGL